MCVCVDFTYVCLCGDYACDCLVYVRVPVWIILCGLCADVCVSVCVVFAWCWFVEGYARYVICMCVWAGDFMCWFALRECVRRCWYGYLYEMICCVPVCCTFVSEWDSMHLCEWLDPLSFEVNFVILMFMSEWNYNIIWKYARKFQRIKRFEQIFF